jgi:threonine dehydratase
MAAANLPVLIRRTPILPVAAQASEVGSERLFVKAENLQVTGRIKSGLPSR